MADMRDLQVAVRDRFEAIHREASRRALDELVRATPRSDGSGGNEEGHLAEDWELDLSSDGDSFVATLSNNHERPRPEWIELGTAPHVIRATNARALTFLWPKKGAVVHFKQVQHPGYAGAHFIERTLTDDNWSRWLQEAAAQG